MRRMCVKGLFFPVARNASSACLRILGNKEAGCGGAWGGYGAVRGRSIGSWDVVGNGTRAPDVVVARSATTAARGPVGGDILGARELRPRADLGRRDEGRLPRPRRAIV